MTAALIVSLVLLVGTVYAWRSALAAYRRTMAIVNRQDGVLEDWSRELLRLQGHVRGLRNYIDDVRRALAESDAENDALRAERDVLHIEVGLLRARIVRQAAPIGIRRAGSPRLVLLTADDVALLRCDTSMLAQYLCDAVEPETDEQRERMAFLERKLHLQLRISGDRS